MSLSIYESNNNPVLDFNFGAIRVCYLKMYLANLLTKKVSATLSLFQWLAQSNIMWVMSMTDLYLFILTDDKHQMSFTFERMKITNLNFSEKYDAKGD